MTAPDTPFRPKASLSLADKLFHGGARAIGLLVLLIFGSIGFFLALQAVPTLRRYGWHFFTQTQWVPETDTVGLAAVLVGTVVVALIALIISFPLALTTALYISEYAPRRFKSALIALVDLMAAVPSIVYGLWGFFLLEPKAVPVAHWLHLHFGFIPLFTSDTDPRAALWEQSRYIGSAFIAGLVVSMMVVPMGCAVMREVFSQAPQGEREAALALGATRWGAIRAVVLPFGRGGIVGGTMLSLGRALGETVAVLLIISPTFEIKASIIQVGTNTVAAMIAARFGEATSVQLAALLTAGFVLFLITLLVNTLAAIIVNRSRSGADTEI
jgi:phosphate transport system permease protein